MTRTRHHGPWPAVPASIAEARAEVSRFATAAGADPAALGAVALAVSEAVTNVVLHAYLDESKPGQVRVTAENGNATIHVVVADHGRGMLARPNSPGLGVGLPIIGLMTESCDVRSDAARGTELRMSFVTDTGARSQTLA